MADLPNLHTETSAVSTGVVRRSVVVVVDQEDLVGDDLRWALRIATREEGDLVLVVRVSGKQVTGSLDVDLNAVEELVAFPRHVAERVRGVLDAYIGEKKWACREMGSKDEGGSVSDGTRGVRLLLIESGQVVDEVGRLVREESVPLVLFVGREYADPQHEGTVLLRQALHRISCSVGVVVPGSRRGDGDVMVAMGKGAHGKAALGLGASLAGAGDRKLTAMYVEKDIGPDAAGVGHQVLERLLKGTDVEAGVKRVSRRVVVQNDAAKGIVEAGKDESVDCLIVGAARLMALGQERAGTIPSQVLRSRPEATLVILRKAIPLPSRLGRWVDSKVERFVPQLERDGRIRLIDRIQAQSQWNFDFVVLMGLSTIIASMGLLDNSAAVIIGAMLVAPLMTPLLGLGLGVAQGNPRLAGVTVKAASLGFVTAFGIALVSGLVAGEFREASGEMNARDWPQTLDLVIAFVAGLAAAYASGRPGLLAALPGVAIAAALVPPIATSGLAVSIGEWDLALGAFLLFCVNVAAIVIAAALSFRATGIREFGKMRSRNGLLRVAMVALSVVMVFVLVFTPPLSVPSYALTQAVGNALGEEYRLRDMEIWREGDDVALKVDVGGMDVPGAALRDTLKEIAREHLGEGTCVRLTFQYEAVLQ